MATQRVLWSELKRSEIKQAADDNAVVIIPVAAIEQHAEHLPINTDTNICCAIAQKAAENIEEFPVLVLPPIWTGYSPHHMKYPGSITLTHHTFVEVLTEVAGSVAHHGFHKILLLNGHGGNAPVIDALHNKLAHEDDISAMGVGYWQIPPVPERMAEICTTDKGFIGHAGEVETSLQLYLQPELVDQASAQWAPGAWGDPSEASAEKGRLLFEACVDGLTNYVRSYRDGSLHDKLQWRKEVPI